ncbi:MAG: DUF2156 domain-containing protein [Thermodesulfobacteriota bacterium]
MLLFHSSSKAIHPERVLPWQQGFRAGIGKSSEISRSSGFSFEERLAYLRQYGDHCMSFSTLQPGMQYFDMPGVGFIAYKNKWGSQMVLADPVCRKDDQELLIGEFIRRHKRCAFVQISEPVAELMHRKFGFYATQFGQETVIDLESWSTSGKKKQVLRTALNQTRKKGVVIREGDGDTRYRQLSDQWRVTRKIKNREIGFLIRPMDMAYQAETRKFFAYQDNELIGFIFFDPIYRDGRIVGYVPNISRFSQNFRQGIFYSIMVYAMEQFRAEGLEEMNLGLSILVLDDQNKGHESGMLKNIERLIYRYGNFIYNFRGIEFTKSRFCGRTNRFYCAHKHYMPAMKLLSVFKLANVF